MTEKEEREAKDRDDAGDAEPRNLELEIGAEDSAQQQERREFVSQKANCSNPLGSNCTTAPCRFGLFHQVRDRLGDALGKKRFPVDLLGRFLRVQGQERAFRMDDAVAELHFLLLVHEGLADLRVMAVTLRGAADHGRPIGDGLVLHRGGKILTRRLHRRGGADRADRRHVNVTRGQGDERPGGTGVGY